MTFHISLGKTDESFLSAQWERLKWGLSTCPPPQTLTTNALDLSTLKCVRKASRPLKALLVSWSWRPSGLGHGTSLGEHLSPKQNPPDWGKELSPQPWPLGLSRE